MKRFKFGRLMTLVCALLSLVLAFSLVACGGDADKKDDAKLTLDQTKVSVAVDSSVAVKVTSNTSDTITWSISPSGFATVTGNGKNATVKGVKEGKATLTAKAGSKTATCEITVTAKAGGEVSLTLPKAETVLAVDGVEQITATYNGTGTLTFVSADPQKVTVTQDAENPKKATIKGVALTTEPVDVTVSDGEKSAKIAVTVADTYEIVFGENGEGKTVLSNPKKWYYWNDQGWTGSTCSVSDARYVNGKVSIDYSCSAGADVNGIQLFYYDDTHTVEKAYTLTCKVSTVKAVTATINGTEVELAAGESKDDVQIQFNEPAPAQYEGASISIQIKVNNGDENTFTISDVVMTEVQQTKLTAPTIEVGAEYAVTITPAADADKVASYEMGVFKADVQDPVIRKAVETGDKIDVSSLATGTYTVKVRAIPKDSIANAASDWSEGKQISVENENPSTPIAIVENEADAIKSEKSDKWGLFTTMGSTGTVTTAQGSLGTLKVNHNPGDQPWKTQLFYEMSSATAGNLYTLTLKVTAPGNNATIQVNGKSVEVTSAKQEVTVTRAEGENNASICIMFGTSSPAPAGEYVFEDITYTEVSELPPLEGAELPEGEGWTGIDLSGMVNSVADKYTIGYNAEKPNSVTISHAVAINEAGVYPNVNKSVAYGKNNKIYMRIVNNADTAAVLKISIQNPGDQHKNTMTTATVKRTGGDDTVTNLEWGCDISLAAKEEIVFECTINTANAQTIAFVLNDVADGAAIGNVTISYVCMKTEA